MTELWTPLATTTLSSSSSTVSFSSITTGYRDLVILADFQASTGGIFGIRFNNDSTTSYSRRYMIGDGTNATGGTDSSYTYMRLKATGTFRTMIRAEIFDYDTSDRNKLLIFRGDSGINAGGGEMIFTAGGWPVTSAINSVQCFLTTGTFDIGSTFSLWGSNRL